MASHRTGTWEELLTSGLQTFYYLGYGNPNYYSGYEGDIVTAVSGLAGGNRVSVAREAETGF